VKAGGKQKIKLFMFSDVEKGGKRLDVTPFSLVDITNFSESPTATIFTIEE
jgi:hypothetical protein